MSLVLSFDGGAIVGSNLSMAGWQLPATLTQEQWKAAGKMLAQVDQAKQWWLGDWWNKGVDYGEGEAACEEIGVEYQTAANCGSIAKAFDFSRRREKLTFSHHAESCSIEDADERERFLDWAEETIKETGKPRSVRELREAIRDYLNEQGWTEDERERRAQVEQGAAIVANQRGDQRLIQWAQFKGLAARVDRQSKWGNPFEMGPDGTRDQVCDAYGVYFPLKKSLHKDLGELRGKVLLCWCHPERCHGHYLAELANGA